MTKTELIPERNYNSNKKRFRNYMGRKRKKKQMVERPKEEDEMMKEIKKINIRSKNKGWRYKEDFKRKKYKSKEGKIIIEIYQQRIKYLEEKKTPIMEEVKIEENIRRKKKRNNRQNEEVRAWRNPQETSALAMLRNFILLLKRNKPEEEKGREIYYKIRKKQEEIIHKEIEKKKGRIRQRIAERMIWESMENLMKEVIQEEILRTTNRIREWLRWTKEIVQETQIMIAKSRKEEVCRMDHAEATAVRGIKTPGKTVVATVRKTLKETINRTGQMIKIIQEKWFIEKKKFKVKFKEFRKREWLQEMKLTKYNRLISIKKKEHGVVDAKEYISQIRYRLGLIKEDQITISGSPKRYAEKLQEILETGKIMNQENAENCTNRSISSMYPPIPMADENNNRDTQS
jgi:hypothetical protein